MTSAKQALEKSRWENLLVWLRTKGFAAPVDVEPRLRKGAGRGLFSTRSFEALSPLINIPPAALLNSRTLKAIYPDIYVEGFDENQDGTLLLNGTQFLSIYLCIHRPNGEDPCKDPHFGPYISTLPRDFSSHPLTWIVKDKEGVGKAHETGLLRCLPPSALSGLKEVESRFWRDWSIALEAKDVYPQLYSNDEKSKLNVENFLWGWLTVNTRCLFLRVFSKNLPLSNLTLFPIIDLANHTSSKSLPQVVYSAPTHDIWGNGHNRIAKPHDLVFLSPDRPVKIGEELYLRYGGHPNRTLFVEYGFVDDVNDEKSGELEVSDVVDELFASKPAGGRIRQILDEDGFLGNFQLYESPPPAHPSWRLLVALRLINLDLFPENTPEEVDGILSPWRKVALGIAETVSEENEAAVRRDLGQLCERLILRAESGMQRLMEVSEDQSDDDACDWFDWAKGNVRMLWEEERKVARAVQDASQSGELF